MNYVQKKLELEIESQINETTIEKTIEREVQWIHQLENKVEDMINELELGYGALPISDIENNSALTAKSKNKVR